MRRLANQPRGTQRYRAIRREDEDALTQEIKSNLPVNTVVMGIAGSRRCSS